MVTNTGEGRSVPHTSLNTAHKHNKRPRCVPKNDILTGQYSNGLTARNYRIYIHIGANAYLLKKQVVESHQLTELG